MVVDANPDNSNDNNNMMVVMIANDLPDEVTHLVALAPHLFPARDVWKHLDDWVKEGGDEILPWKRSALSCQCLYSMEKSLSCQRFY